MDEKNAGVNTSKLKWCDPRCNYARFPDNDSIDGSRSCQTYLALYCTELKKYVTRNAPCEVKYGARRPKSSF
ncbi:MAG: hypothetical protein Kow00108_09940 [Calditrichia bacterium]